MSDDIEGIQRAVREQLAAAFAEGGGAGASATLCLAWSGGVDSTVLFDALQCVAPKLDVELAAVHVDHGLREESSRDAAFCRRLAARHGVPLAVETLEVRRGTSTEAHARRQRYAALAEAATRLGATHVATAHHANDAVETALLNWIRGSGGEGLASLAGPAAADGPIASWSDLELVRPLRTVAAEAVESYAEARDLEWRVDPTNESAEPTRNRLRREVVPALTGEAGGVGPLVRTLENLGDEARALRRRGEALVADPSPGDSRVARRFGTRKLASAPRAEAAVALRIAARALPGGVGWDREHLDRALAAVAAVADGSSESRRIDLRAARLVVEDDWTVLERSRERGARELDERRVRPATLVLDDARGEFSWFRWRLRWRVFERSPDEAIPGDEELAWFDADALPDRLLLRGPAEGEAFRPLGGSSTTAVTEVLRRGDVPVSERWRWPVLATPGADGGDALWVAGLRQSDIARIERETERILEVRRRVLRRDAETT